jgi:hypothetical protein
MIHAYVDIPKKFCPKIPFEANIITDTDWESAPTTEISIITIPTLDPLPYGTKNESTLFDNKFIKEMQKSPRSTAFGPNPWQMSSIRQLPRTGQQNCQETYVCSRTIQKLQPNTCRHKRH